MQKRVKTNHVSIPNEKVEISKASPMWWAL